MTAEEMRQEFHSLYEQMADSNDVHKMHIFGCVLKEMMEWMIQNKPDYAEEYLHKLESIRWKNYLTPKEADKIVAEITPKAPWNKETWKQAMDSLQLNKEHAPYYNSCALWATMNMLYSIHVETLALLMGKTVGEVSPEVFYHLANDLLTGKDGKFDIRSYLGI